MHLFKLFILTTAFNLFSGLSLFGQVQTIQLAEPTTTDGIDKGIETFKTQPKLSPKVQRNLSNFPDTIQNKFKESLSILIPESWKKEDLLFTSVFYTWKSSDDHSIDIIVKKRNKGEQLYIDFDNDETFKANQKGRFFPYSEKKLRFSIIDRSDSKQRTDRLLLRLPLAIQNDPSLKKDFFKKYFDKEGNLNTYWTNYWRKYDPKFTGAKNTFYFTERLNLRKGFLNLPSGSILVGLYDYNSNGLYNEKGDKILVDLNQDSLLSPKVNSELFNIQDTLSVRKNNFVPTEINRYGDFIQLVEIDSTPNHASYLTYQDKKSKENKYYGIGKVKSLFLDQIYRSIDDKFIQPKDYSSDFLLLNFWGEWCGPCIAEIPELKNLYLSNSKITILSFLKTGNIEKAKQIISAKKLRWSHIRTSQKVERKFKISSYPTNILINLSNMNFYQFGKLDHKIISNIISDAGIKRDQ